ncbi:carboxy terminal-processing peptidase [Xanthocytophaga agilis]|uniref:Carboxy terminal-processing peptidase n=1 Tax=Xanthocytophaga agilis TaxID=3048010 RepID=A0AAE3UGG8_9BACT|nr:carboxy terminal-processing peptidase [Xanthocytophaga agilis]MDJ1504928.1 carboxy terminal-processing peptidase [Xanthocytophaga agilis]
MSVFLPCNYLRILCLIVFVLIGGESIAQQVSAGNWQQQAMSLRKTLETKHYTLRPVDDNLSEQILYQFIETIDPHRLYFQASDWQLMKVYRAQIDDELAGKEWKFLPLVSSLYKNRLLQAEKRIEEITQKPFVFSATETIVFSDAPKGKDSLNFAANDKDAIQKWTKWLKYQTIDLMVDDVDEIIEGKIAAINAKEPASRLKVRTVEQRKIKRILESPAGFDEFIASAFFNAIAECFDPHSNYFSLSTEKNFEASLAKEGLSYGIDLEENDKGDVCIARLVPGGPAWKSNTLHKGDVLLTLQWTGKSLVDLNGADVYEVEELLNASSSDKVEITVQKANGQEEKVALVREKIREDENIVKSYVLKGDKKIGYISLPGFYTETEDATSLGCANDVAKEILKLKKVGIDGLILDIRYNGGGSLQEGLNLAGIFVDEGPLGIIQGSDLKPSIMKDQNRGTIYDGPLVLMINGQSASASELLAATLQDYNRALIVGSSTFGKATGQIVLPLSANANPMALKEAKADWGYAKVTVNKLYRITGKSAQLKGVQPHIYLPDMYETILYKEHTKPFAMPSDSVNKKIYYTPLKALPIEELSAKSKTRTMALPVFRAIQKQNGVLRNRIAKINRSIPLHPASYRTYVLETYIGWEEFEKTMEDAKASFTVENTGYDKEVLQIDAYTKEINEGLIENITQDIYIEEAYQIMKDWLALLK